MRKSTCCVASKFHFHQYTIKKHNQRRHRQIASVFGWDSGSNTPLLFSGVCVWFWLFCRRPSQASSRTLKGRSSNEWGFRASILVIGGARHNNHVENCIRAFGRRLAHTRPNSEDRHEAPPPDDNKQPATTTPVTARTPERSRRRNRQALPTPPALSASPSWRPRGPATATPASAPLRHAARRSLRAPLCRRSRAGGREANNVVFCPAQEKFHTVVFKGVRQYF